jgi:hypothetical protein
MAVIVLSCEGVPEVSAPEVAADIEAEFAEHRAWWKNVRCTWDGTRLVLQAESDEATDVPALIDEFSDCISAYVSEPFDGGIQVVSVT